MAGSRFRSRPCSQPSGTRQARVNNKNVRHVSRGFEQLDGVSVFSTILHDVSNHVVHYLAVQWSHVGHTCKIHYVEHDWYSETVVDVYILEQLVQLRAVDADS